MDKALRYAQLDQSEEITMRILELYSELLAEGRSDLSEPSASMESGFSDFMLQKRMQAMEEEEHQIVTDRKVDGSKINNTKLKKVEELNLRLR